MVLKREVTAEEFDKLETAIQTLYTKTDSGGYKLQVEDDGTADKIKEFRDNNITLKKQQKELEDKLNQWKGFDLTAVQEALKTAEEMKDKKLLDQGKFDELLEQRTDRMKKEYEGQIDKLSKDLKGSTELTTKYKGKLEETLIDSRLSKALSGIGALKQDALEYILPQGHKVWKLDEDTNLTPFGDDGNVLYGSNPKEQLTPEEWAVSVAQKTPWLFEDTKGANATGNNSNKHQRNIGDKTIDGSDKTAFGTNIEDIASGKVKVSLGS